MDIILLTFEGQNNFSVKVQQIQGAPQLTFLKLQRSTTVSEYMHIAQYLAKAKMTSKSQAFPPPVTYLYFLEINFTKNIWDKISWEEFFPASYVKVE